MAFDIATRLDTLGTRMKELNSNSLTLTRTGESNITVTNFTPEKLDVTQAAIHGIVLVEDKSQDFVFDTSEYDSWTDSFPKVGDTIVWGTRTFAVMSIGDETYTFTTSSRKRIRVHAKQVS